MSLWGSLDLMETAMTSTNFFVDFAAFNALGLMSGANWMVVFSIATFLALITRHFQNRLMERPARARGHKEKPDFSALPAFRDDVDQRNRRDR